MSVATTSASEPIQFEGSARDPVSNVRAGFTGSITISRKDHGVT